MAATPPRFGRTANRFFKTDPESYLLLAVVATIFGAAGYTAGRKSPITQRTGLDSYTNRESSPMGRNESTKSVGNASSESIYNLPDSVKHSAQMNGR
ncbi:hypothetical protein H4R35_005548 [Dimargaris xerosporica]|nr:hypothetical protein H4R35_005548 [Dimargaris xerosporica]